MRKILFILHYLCKGNKKNSLLVDRNIETVEAATPEDDCSMNNELSPLTKSVGMIASTAHDMESLATTTFV